MQQKPAIAGRKVPVNLIAKALGLEVDNVKKDTLSPTAVQTEVAHTMVLIKDMNLLNQCKPDNEQLIEISKQYEFEGLYCFAFSVFDVILSQFCIHNIKDKNEQEKACFEIARVLKPGGKALVGDYLPTIFYAKAVEKAGLTILSNKAHFATAYGLTWLVEATKK